MASDGLPVERRRAHGRRLLGSGTVDHDHEYYGRSGDRNRRNHQVPVGAHLLHVHSDRCCVRLLLSDHLLRRLHGTVWTTRGQQHTSRNVQEGRAQIASRYGDRVQIGCITWENDFFLTSNLLCSFTGLNVCHLAIVLGDRCIIL